MEDSIPEEQSSSPDTPVVVVAPDQLVASADAQQITPLQENVQASSPNHSVDIFLDTNCPLSETLRNLRLETSGYPLDNSLKWSAFLDVFRIFFYHIAFCCIMESIWVSDCWVSWMRRRESTRSYWGAPSAGNRNRSMRWGLLQRQLKARCLLGSGYLGFPCGGASN